MPYGKAGDKAEPSIGSLEMLSEAFNRPTKLTRKIPRACGHGNAGLASYFLDLAHIKVKPGGTIAFVLPFTMTIGTSWAKARKLLINYGSTPLKMRPV